MQFFAFSPSFSLNLKSPLLLPKAGLSIPIPAVILREAIRRTAFAVTTEPSRFTIQGAKIVIDDRSLTMVATDGHRLAFTQFPLVNSTGQKLDLLVPKKTLAQLEDLLDREIRRDAESQIEIGDGAGNQLCFAVGNHSLFSRTLTGTFPNWAMVLPKISLTRRRSARRIFAARSHV